MAHWVPCRLGRCAAVGRGPASLSLTRDLQESAGRKFSVSFLDLMSWTKFQKSTMLQAFWLNKAFHKFKQSRITRFGFSFQKGKGIPPVAHSLPPKGFSLLYAMIKYDPDERIAAHQALQHPYFQELWAPETRKIKITGKYIRASTSAFVAHFNGKSKDSQLWQVFTSCVQ